jgi:hypothetical protein
VKLSTFFLAWPQIRLQVTNSFLDGRWMLLLGIIKGKLPGNACWYASFWPMPHFTHSGTGILLRIRTIFFYIWPGFFSGLAKFCANFFQQEIFCTKWPLNPFYELRVNIKVLIISQFYKTRIRIRIQLKRSKIWIRNTECILYCTRVHDIILMNRYSDKFNHISELYKESTSILTMYPCESLSFIISFQTVSWWATDIKNNSFIPY